MEDIFKKWENKYKHETIIRDGVIDQNKWGSTRRKLLFICKEYYRYQEDQKGNHSDSLRKWVSEGARNKPFFKNLLVMSLAVHEPQMGPPDDVEKDDEWKAAQKSLLSSALINLKKVVGKSYSTEADIRNYTVQNSAILKEQIGRIAPEIIICGGSMRFVSRIYELKPINEDKGIWGEANTTGPYFIDGYHPAYWIEDYYNFHGFIQNAMNEINSYS